MTLWRLRELSDSPYARASRVGTWIEEGDPPQSIRVKPLVIEWEPGSVVVGDFTWPGTGDYMAKRCVAQELVDRGFKGFELGPVEIVANRDYKRRKPRNMIQLPYAGPELADLFVTHWVNVNRERSTLKVKGARDGEPIFDLEGFERIEVGDWHRDTGVLDRIHVPRTPGMGAYVEEGELDGCDLFKVKGLSGWIFCTDRLRNFILDKGYTNVTFFEVGETINDKQVSNKKDSGQ
jgi:hypothetical protein